MSKEGTKDVWTAG